MRAKNLQGNDCKDKKILARSDESHVNINEKVFNKKKKKLTNENIKRSLKLNICEHKNMLSSKDYWYKDRLRGAKIHFKEIKRTFWNKSSLVIPKKKKIIKIILVLGYAGISLRNIFVSFRQTSVWGHWHWISIGDVFVHL